MIIIAIIVSIAVSIAGIIESRDKKKKIEWLARNRQLRNNIKMLDD